MRGIIWRSLVGAAALGAVVAGIGWTAPAEAFIVGVGVPFPGYYAPYPSYPYPYPYPYAYPYAPPPAYYPAPAYAPQPAAQPSTVAQITYTSRPAFTNSSGETCREFKTAQNTLGTACRDTGGQWRVQN